MSQSIGAPLDNHNAVRHGMYSRSFKSAERKAVSLLTQKGLKPEIDLQRVLLGRLALRLKIAEARAPLTLKQSIDALYTASTVIARLNVLYRTHPASIEKKYAATISALRAQERSEEEIRQYIESEEALSSGGQPGNSNAIKHGLYASIFKPSELRKLEQVTIGDLRDEIALLRSLTFRLVERLSDSQPGIEEHLRALRVISYAGIVLAALSRTADLLFPPQEPFMVEWEKARAEFQFFIEPGSPEALEYHRLEQEKARRFQASLQQGTDPPPQFAMDPLAE